MNTLLIIVEKCEFLELNQNPTSTYAKGQLNSD